MHAFLTAIEFKKLVAVYNSTPCGVGGVVVTVQFKKWITFESFEISA